jgi:hypothetical protein
VSVVSIWRVEALAAPPLVRPCPTCRSEAPFATTGKFRVNANGGRLDVWLLYRCPACGVIAKRSVLRRIRPRDVDPARLDAYHRNDAAVARAHAFECVAATPLPYAVARPPLPACGALAVRVEQPFAVGVRIDSLLAGELGWSRSAVARAFARGHVALDAGRSLRDRVRDGEAFQVVIER